MTKQELRKKYRERREQFTASDLSKLDDLLLIKFQQAGIPFVNTLMSYFPIPGNNEPDTHLYAKYLQFVNPQLNVCFPVSDFANYTMTAISINAETLFQPNMKGIPEPIAGTETDPLGIDIIFVPLLTFDQKGYRVGYGKGFYDRFLLRCSSDCIKVGFSYFEPVEAISDKDDFDVPLDLCITPQEVYVF